MTRVAAMSTPPADLGQRLYGMMQYHMAAYAQQVSPEVPSPRNVVQLQDALDAVLQLAAVIDEATQAKDWIIASALSPPAPFALAWSRRPIHRSPETHTIASRTSSA